MIVTSFACTTPCGFRDEVLEPAPAEIKCSMCGATMRRWTPLHPAPAGNARIWKGE